MFIFILIFSISLFSQCPPDTTGYQVIQDLTICFTKVNVDVSFKESCNCYYYNYTITSPQENKGNIWEIFTEFKTNNTYKTIDQTLPYNPQCDYPHAWEREEDLERTYKLIPYSVLSCPNSWFSGPHTGFGTDKEEYFIKPGQTVEFKIASKFPPGERTFLFCPDEQELIDIWFEQYAPDPSQEGYYPAEANPPVAIGEIYEYRTSTIGPVDPEELELFNGGGQKPDDVNLFLRYGNPKDTQTTLPPGQDKFELLIYYGKTTKPETFKATLNDVDIKNLFKPVLGGGDYVKLNLQSGRNILEFSIDGINQKGSVANDKDRLVIIVK